MALLLVGGVTALSFSRVRAERDRARLEADKADEVSDFLADLFTSSNPAESLLTRALDTRREVLSPTHPAVGTTLHQLGLLLERQGRE